VAHQSSSLGSIRIIGGFFRRHVLHFPAIQGVRPTPDRVRETLFNWLGQELNGWSVYDLFAGSGGLALEALSRGAEKVIAIESHPVVAKHLRDNAITLLDRLPSSALTPSFQVLQQDVRKILPSLPIQQADLILADPPFGAFEEWYTFILEAAERHLKPTGWLYLEAPKTLIAPSPWKTYRTLQAGHVHAHLWQRENSPTL
jgi:16S rRNA (guanine966-N2)-methyltransferase